MNSQRNRPRHKAQSPQYLSPQPFPTGPSSHEADTWDSPATARPRAHSAVNSQPHPAGHSTSYNAPIAFPEPQIYRSVSDYRAYHPASTSSDGLSHSRSTHNLRATNLHRGASVTSVSSTASSYYRPSDEDRTAEEIYYGDAYGSISDDFNRLTLDADEAVRRFQKGEIPETEQEWHKLIPHEALDALGKQEVQRQSVIFEVIKSERDYVADLRSIQDVFINGLRNSPLPIIQPSRLADFINDVFCNLNEILRLHERMLVTLFRRQQEQHPLIQSVSDIVLDSTWITEQVLIWFEEIVNLAVLREEFRSSYEVYIEHYPLSESRHRKELASNPAYKELLKSVSDDPRIRKRDIITFLSRPVTRLPRLSLLIEQVLKLTDKAHEHPDLESLPTILGILSDFLKSTQPGIAAAESKAKLWDLCEHLEYQKGEIIDMDLKDVGRTVFYSGPVVRRTRGDTGFLGWTDLTATLLDNYFILTRDVKRANVVVKQELMSRPIPLSHLRCASFDAPSETRRGKSEERGILDSLRSQTVDMFPFTIYHASNVLHRRYTLCVISDGLRQRWRSILEEAMGVYRIRQEANMWYYFRTLSEDFFRVSGPKTTGTAATAAPFMSGGRRFIVVGCRTGVYVSTWGTEDFKRVLGLENPTQLAVVHELGGKQFHRLLVHHENSILSYSLDILARVALCQSQPSTLDASMERVAGQDSNVMFFRLAEIGQRILIMYASKRFLQVSPSLRVLEAVDVSGAVATRKKKPAIFQPFGEPGYVPKDAFDISPLSRSVGIVTRDGIVISDPTNFAKSAATVVPDLHSNDPGVTLLKSRVEGAKPLGLVRVSSNETMVIYDTIGFYITRSGALSRSAGFVKWETQAQSFAYRGDHVLLFSPDFIEVRDVQNGRLLQVMEAVDMRLLYFNPSAGNNDPMILAMKGKKADKDDFGIKIVELAATVALKSPVRDAEAAHTPTPIFWDGWDIAS